VNTKPPKRNSVSFDSKKAKHHRYSLPAILWVIQIQNYGQMSLRKYPFINRASLKTNIFLDFFILGFFY